MIQTLEWVTEWNENSSTALFHFEMPILFYFNGKD